jgi:hypothetical protein
MPVTPTIKDLPTDWRVVRFEPQRGLGYLVREGSSEVAFDIAVWQYDYTQLDAVERRRTQLDSERHPEYPAAGEPVQVTWKRSVLGRIIPASVTPTARTRETGIRLLVDDWLERVGREVPGVRDLTWSTLITSLQILDAEIGDSYPADGRFAAGELSDLLCCLAAMRDVDPGWYAEHASWIYADDQRWDRDAAADFLPRMVGLPSRAVAPLPAGGDESLWDFAKRVNERAEQARSGVRLFLLAEDSDRYGLVALSPPAAKRLVDAGAIALDQDS